MRTDNERCAIKNYYYCLYSHRHHRVAIFTKNAKSRKKTVTFETELKTTLHDDLTLTTRGIRYTRSATPKLVQVERTTYRRATRAKTVHPTSIGFIYYTVEITDSEKPTYKLSSTGIQAHSLACGDNLDSKTSNIKHIPSYKKWNDTTVTFSAF